MAVASGPDLVEDMRKSRACLGQLLAFEVVLLLHIGGIGKGDVPAVGGLGEGRAGKGLRRETKRVRGPARGPLLQGDIVDCDGSRSSAFRP